MNVSSITIRVLVTTGTRYYYRPWSVVGEYWHGEVAEVLERVVVVSVQVAYTHTHTHTDLTDCIIRHVHTVTHTYTHTAKRLHTVWARERCRISPPRFLAECCKRQLNQGSYVLQYLGCLLFLICIEFVCLYFPVLFSLSVSVK